MNAEIHPPEPLSEGHRVEGFDCGTASLNDYLLRHALANHRSGTARSFVASTADASVVGFYSLAASQMQFADAPPRLQIGAPHHPIPMVLLARLAVDRRWQGVGLGKNLLRDAIRRVLHASEGLGIRALLVHAKDERAKAFYESFDFSPVPSMPLHLILLLKDARRLSIPKTPGNS